MKAQNESKRKWRLWSVAATLGTVGVAASVFAGPRPESDVTPDGVQQKKLVGVSRIESLPPLPPGVDPGTMLFQPTNVPVPIYRLLSEERMARGGTAYDGYAEAVVYRSGPDDGYGLFRHAATGNFTGSLVHLGNGFPVDGGEIKRYEILVYNSVSNPQTYPSDMGVIVSLWDGDPLGILDTRISDPPQQIPQTVCTFTGLEIMGGHGSNGCVGGLCDGGFLDGTPCAVDSDCGLCPSIGHDDMDDCPGLYWLQCDLPKKVMVPSRNLWMIAEFTGGCRMAWRAQWYIGPSVAAIGEENFCGPPGASTCTTATVPCADLVIQQRDNASEADALGVGTCCEDTSITCNHADTDTRNDCAHPSTCSDGVADDWYAFCYGAPEYFAHLVTSVYANTDTYIQLVPAETLMEKPGSHIILTLELGGWAPLTLKTWMATIDATGYTSGIAGELTPQVEPCVDASECKNQAAEVPCENGFCVAGWQDFVPPANNVLMGINAVDISNPFYRYGSTGLGAAKVDPGKPCYGGSLALDMSWNAKGTFTVGFQPDPNSFMKDATDMNIPLVALIPAEITVQVGKCCDPLGGGNFACISAAAPGAKYMTYNDCMAATGDAGIFTPDEMCDADPTNDNDECGCTEDIHCNDGNVCTNDTCDVPTGVCYNTPKGFDLATQCCHPDTGVITDLVDIAKDEEADECTFDYCDLGPDPIWLGTAIHDYVVMEGAECEDQHLCEIIDEICVDGLCIGTSINDYPCLGMLPDPDTYCKALDPTETAPASCDVVNDACICVPPSLNFQIVPSDKPNGTCFAHGEKMFVDVVFESVPQVVNGGQFTVLYDPDCVEFVSISPAGAPYVFELYEDVDEAAGTITYAVGVDPMGGVGTNGFAALATISFIKLPGCVNCMFAFGGENPVNTYLVNDEGKPIEIPVLKPSMEVHENDKLTLKVPADMKVNVDCDMETAIVAWDWPWADSSCFDEDCNAQFDKCYDPNLTCWGYDPAGMPYADDVVYKGGEMPLGTSTFGCVVTSNICGSSSDDGWTVTVNDTTTMDVVIQLSPIITGDVIRCIEFELFEDCVQDPLVFSRDILFGGLWDHIGQFTDTLKIPDSGKWACITARDQVHSLRSVSDLLCVDGVYFAEFKGDPFWDGNWLINGNLDGWQKENPNISLDVIDIVDFGQFVAGYLDVLPINTPCVDGHGQSWPHADINGDGIVNALDFAFVLMNYMAQSKDSCCPGSSAAATEGRTSISVRELRAAGLGDLAVADLNRDGMVDADDMAAFMAGQVPSAKPIRPGSSLR